MPVRIGLIGDYSPEIVAHRAIPRALELAAAVHPFFVGTLFQPERAALRDETPPLVRTFIRAACDAFASRFSSP